MPPRRGIRKHRFANGQITADRIDRLKDGGPPHEVQAMAGHASIETVMKCYAEVDIDSRTRLRQTSERATAGIVVQSS